MNTTNSKSSFKDFTDRLKLLVQKRPDLITLTLSNIFTMRLIGNKTHGDLAEIGIAEFVNQYMYDFKPTHVGKDLYRAKSNEEDITITNLLTKITFPVSLKAYGVGPLQLSTDKTSSMFPRLKQEKKDVITKQEARVILNDPCFAPFHQVNVLPLIYDEKKQKCKIMVFNSERAGKSVVKISFEDVNSQGKGRKHPVFRFYDSSDHYICEVRYGDAAANALQRGLWTHSKNGASYFDDITEWIDYSHNKVLVQLFSHALVSSPKAHQESLDILKKNITSLNKHPYKEQ